MITDFFILWRALTSHQTSKKLKNSMIIWKRSKVEKKWLVVLKMIAVLITLTDILYWSFDRSDMRIEQTDHINRIITLNTLLLHIFLWMKTKNHFNIIFFSEIHFNMTRWKEDLWFELNHGLIWCCLPKVIKFYNHLFRCVWPSKLSHTKWVLSGKRLDG